MQPPRGLPQNPLFYIIAFSLFFVEGWIVILSTCRKILFPLDKSLPQDARSLSRLVVRHNRPIDSAIPRKRAQRVAKIAPRHDESRKRQDVEFVPRVAKRVRKRLRASRFKRKIRFPGIASPERLAEFVVPLGS